MASKNGDTGQYQGSQAFAHVLPTDKEFINPNTGSLNYSQALVNLKGVRSSVNLALAITYSDGSLGTFGLPDNWGFNITYVLAGKTLTFQGRTYVLDSEWTDNKLHKSGLKYMNDHGTKFSAVEPHSLPSGRPGEYCFRLQASDGSSYYYDFNGKLLEQHDIYGNQIHFKYVSGADGDVMTAALESIEDSWGQVIEFEYGPGMLYGDMKIKLPDGSMTTVEFDSGGVRKIVDAANNITTFEYEIEEGLMSQIEYPTGLKSLFDYYPIEYLDNNSTVRYRRAVQTHYKRDQTESNFYEATRYAYGTQSNSHTYTGASLGYTMGGLQDQIMDGGTSTQDYQYDVYKTCEDDKENIMSATLTWYNALHLPVSEEKGSVNSRGQFFPTFKTEYTYDNDLDFAETINYARPSTIEHFRNISSTFPAFYKAMNVAKMKYNEFGNVELLEESMVSSNPDGVYVPQKVTTKTWHTVDLPEAGKIQLPKSSVEEDKITCMTYQTEFTLTSNQCAIGFTKVKYSEGGNDSLLKPWKEKQFEFDNHGRILSETSAWSQGATIPKGSVSSFTVTLNYEVLNGILTEKKTDPSGNTSMTRYDIRMPFGPIVANVLPLGQQESFVYDNIGRLQEHTDFLGTKTKFSYSVGANSNTEMITTPLGYSKLTTLDCMGRAIKITDNGDSTRSSPEPTRVLEETQYDYFSRISAKVDILGLKTSYKHDHLNRVIEVTDPDQNVLEHQFDDASLTSTELVNGIRRTYSVLDNNSQVIRYIKYPCTSNAASLVFLATDFRYDAFGRRLEAISSEVPANEQSAIKVLRKERHLFDADSAQVSQTIIGTGDEGDETLERRFVLDIFGNKYTYTKQTTYVDGRKFLSEGAVKIYDSNNRLTTSRNQIGQEEQYEYNGNNWLVSSRRFDGSKTMYSHDAAGQVVKSCNPSSTTEMIYSSVGRLSEISQGGNTITYEYAKDGSKTSVTYNGHLKQSYILDGTSRVLKETDVLGVSRETTYNTLGHVSSRSCKGETVSYSYGTANHSNNRLIGMTFKGAQNYHQSIAYDGFGNIQQTVARGENGDTFLDTTYVYDSLQRLELQKSASTLSSALQVSHTYSYDGLGQIKQDSTTGSCSSITKFSYDGNSNVISLNIDGEQTLMTYNQIDQRADANFEYDSNGRLLGDDREYKYVFDDQDRLLSVQLPQDKETKFGYHADSMLSKQEGEGFTSDFYYSNETINATSIADAKGNHSSNSFLWSGNKLIASYSQTASQEYFLQQHGSNALSISQDEHTATTYQAYGLKNSTAPPKLPHSFGYRQELVDESSGLIYLRSRFYDPKNMAFVSMDTYHEENRYAYCQGDPINYFDPSGHFPQWAAITLGIVAGVAATAVTGGALAWMLPATMAPLYSSLIVATVGGAVGNAVGGTIEGALSGQGFQGDRLLKDALIGAAAGFVGTFAGAGATAFFVSRGNLAPTLARAYGLGTIVGAAAGSITASIVTAVAYNRDLDIAKLLVNASIAAATAGLGAKVFQKRLGERARLDYNAVRARSPGNQSFNSADGALRDARG